ncbi:MAG: hypothetical protein P4L10_09300 [Acidobacteriaceae bacterium]|nr:hypothetical protein [Acidobacteriaceae bacterium]
MLTLLASHFFRELHFILHARLAILLFVPKLSSALLAAALLAVTLTLGGCKRAESAIHAPAAAFETTEQRAMIATAHQQLNAIPPPSKNLYMSVHSLTDWQNPYITVQPDMVTLHVLLADANPSTFDAGGVLRPVGARRQDLDVRIGDLPAALNAVPAASWPYGRVIAVEEAHNTPAAGLPQVRRNMESAMQMLNDLGIVVDDRTENGTMQNH